jgi:hypothetical protein
MPERVLAAPPGHRPGALLTEARPLRRSRGWQSLAWVLVALAVVGIAVAWIVATRMRPAYDAFGWLVWGHQVLHWDLNTDGAPSWKPLTFLFTLPYALFVGNPQMWLWMITAVASALAAAVFGGRIAYRITGPTPARPWARWAAAAFAGLGVLGMDGYSHLVLISNSDPMIVTLCLAAIDSYLSGRRALAFVLLFLASLGRPETWAFAGLYMLWTWRSAPRLRLLSTAGAVVIPLAWFIVPAITSHSWFISGDLALHSVNVIHGNRPIGVLGRLFGLPAPAILPLWAAALALATARRDHVWLTLIAAAALWVAIEIAFALHGWSAVPRYLMEPAAVMTVVGGAAFGQLLAWSPRPGLVGWSPVAVGLALVVALVPTVRSRARIAHGEIDDAHRAAKVLSRLEAVIEADGGPDAIKSCGQPVTELGNASELAWATQLNVGDVGWRPGRSIRRGLPIVFFKPHLLGWQVHPIHILAADRARCSALRTDSAFG